MKPFGEYVNFSWKRILGKPESIKTDTELYIDGCQVVLLKQYRKDKEFEKNKRRLQQC